MNGHEIGNCVLFYIEPLFDFWFKLICLNHSLLPMLVVYNQIPFFSPFHSRFGVSSVLYLAQITCLKLIEGFPVTLFALFVEPV